MTRTLNPIETLTEAAGRVLRLASQVPVNHGYALADVALVAEQHGGEDHDFVPRTRWDLTLLVNARSYRRVAGVMLDADTTDSQVMLVAMRALLIPCHLACYESGHVEPFGFYHHDDQRAADFIADEGCTIASVLHPMLDAARDAETPILVYGQQVTWVAPDDAPCIGYVENTDEQDGVEICAIRKQGVPYAGGWIESSEVTITPSGEQRHIDDDIASTTVAERRKRVTLSIWNDPERGRRHQVMQGGMPLFPETDTLAESVTVARRELARIPGATAAIWLSDANTMQIVEAF